VAQRVDVKAQLEVAVDSGLVGAVEAVVFFL
jgi:hypothetical protein